MMKRKKILLIICFTALCLSSAPARADMFGFGVYDTHSVFDGSSGFSTDATSGYFVISRHVAPLSSATLLPETTGSFSLSMTISNIGPFTADGVGSFTITDTDSTADTITGDITGGWFRLGPSNFFGGLLSNVVFNDNGSTDGDFNGDSGSAVLMTFAAAPTLWNGTLMELTVAGTPWFGDIDSAFDVTGGTVGASVIPVPAAVLLGILGLGVVGIKLRRFA